MGNETVVTLFLGCHSFEKPLSVNRRYSKLVRWRPNFVWIESALRHPFIGLCFCKPTVDEAGAHHS